MRAIAVNLVEPIVIQPNAMDAFIGVKITLLRISLGLTKDAFARAVKVSEEHLDHWEAGHDRVSALGLMSIAQRFQMPVSYFFADMAIRSIN